MDGMVGGLAALCRDWRKGPSKASVNMKRLRALLGRSRSFGNDGGDGRGCTGSVDACTCARGQRQSHVGSRRRLLRADEEMKEGGWCVLRRCRAQTVVLGRRR